MYEHTLAPCLVTSQAAMNGCNLRLQIWRPVLPARTKSASKPPAVMTGIRNSTLFMDGLTSHVAPPASAAASGISHKGRSGTRAERQRQS